ASRAAWIGAFAAALLVIVVTNIDQRPQHLWGYAVRHSIVAGSIVTILWLCMNHAQSLVGRILESRPLVTLGLLSYSLYVWQQLFINPFHYVWICRWPYNVGLALLTSVLSYRWIESPFLRLKERYADGSRFIPKTW